MGYLEKTTQQQTARDHYNSAGPKAKSKMPAVSLLQKVASDEELQLKSKDVPKVIQRVYKFGVDRVNTLANATDTGKTFMDSIEAETALSISSSGSGWKTNTKDPNALGIYTTAEDYAKLTSEAVPNEADTKDLKVKIAHELTHLRHFTKSRFAYDFLGGNQPAIKEFGGDAEEELTITGNTKVPIAVWADACKKLASARKLLSDRITQDELTHTQTPSRALKKGIDADKLSLSKLMEPLMDPTTLPGVTVLETNYVFTDALNENTVRATLGQDARTKY